MKEKRFATNYDTWEVKEDSFPGERIVEDFGFATPEEVIMSLISAGERLKTARGEYDFDEGVDDEDIFEQHHPERVPGFDIADASQILHETDGVVRQYAREVFEHADDEAILARAEAVQKKRKKKKEEPSQENDEGGTDEST